MGFHDDRLPSEFVAPNRPSEIRPAGDRPISIERDGFISDIHHRPSRSDQRFESRHCQLSEAFGIILEASAIRRRTVTV